MNKTSARRLSRKSVSAIPLLMLSSLAGGQNTAAIFDRNLVTNGNADAGPATNDAGAITGWANPSGTPMVRAYPSAPKAPLGVPADHGPNFFAAGSANKSTLSQLIDLSPGANAIDTRGVTFELSAYLAGEGSDDDTARVIVSFADEKNQELSSATIGPVTPEERQKQTISLLRRTIGPVPPGARKATVTLDLEKTHGSRVTASVDDVALVLHRDAAPESFLGKNLIANPGAEDGGSWENRTSTDIPHWSGDGYFTLEWYNPKGGDQRPTTPGPKDRGSNYFFGGEDPKSAAWQDIYIAPATKLIDDKYELEYTLSGWLGGLDRQPDSPTVTAEFRDWNGKVLATATLGPVTPAQRKFQTMLLELTKSGAVPADAKIVRITLTMTRADGSTNDSAVDNLSLTLARRPRPPKK